MILVQMVGSIEKQVMAFSLCLALQKKYISGITCEYAR
jgi:hypothetical protein